MNWFGVRKEKRTQLYFPDYGGFEFRKLPLEDSCLVEKANGEVVKAWKHFYCNQLTFDGYKNIHAAMVTLGFDRDFVLDPFNKIPVAGDVSGKPKRNEADIKKWTSQVAESQRYKVMNKHGNLLLLDKITMFLGIGLLLLIIIYGATRAYGGS